MWIETHFLLLVGTTLFLTLVSVLDKRRDALGLVFTTTTTTKSMTYTPYVRGIIVKPNYRLVIPDRKHGGLKTTRTAQLNGGGFAVGVGVVSDNTDNDPNAPPKRFMYMTKEQDEELASKGEEEAKLMRQNQSSLKVSKAKGLGTSGGFGGGSGGGSNSKKGAQVRAHARVLQKEGLVRIDNVIPTRLVDKLRDYAIALRARSVSDIENGSILDSQERFADILLNRNRCDLKLPLGPREVNSALHHILSKSVVGQLIEHVFDTFGGPNESDGKLAELYEVNCFMSNSGARRQLVHADNSCGTVGLPPKEPVMLTCFVSLQDIDETMGPTMWIPRTHNIEAHDQFYEVAGVERTDPSGGNDARTKKYDSTKDRLLRTRKNVVGTLPRGACVVFDPRTLHCGGANTCLDPEKTRALFYFSFKNPRVEHPGCPSTCGYGIDGARLTLEELCKELMVAEKYQQHQQEEDKEGSTGSKRLDAIACFP